MDRIKYLLLAFLREAITPAEQAELDTWLAEDVTHRALLEELQDPEQVAEALGKLDQLNHPAAWAKVEQHAAAVRAAKGMEAVETLLQEQQTRRMPWRRYAVAAAIIGLLGLGSWLLLRNHLQPTQPVATTHDVPAPATNRATLTLASGQTVYLDSVVNGQLAVQGNASVVKQASGQLAYQSTPNNRMTPLNHGELLYNTLTNPRGSKVITLTLSDGTKVWLNAESSIRYPAIFLGPDRTVAITGEAYLEVAKDASKPFKVTVAGETIDVLGTAFNINAYPDERAIKTTLVSGAIRVRRMASSSAGLTLLPGNQAVLPTSDSGATGPLFIATNANLDQVLAWKNGRFAFQGADLPTVMRQLARWYDVKVRYEGAIPQRGFSGKIDNSLSLDQVLHILTKTRIHYTIGSERELVIRP